jgi:hypothetical protein
VFTLSVGVPVMQQGYLCYPAPVRQATDVGHRRGTAWDGMRHLANSRSRSVQLMLSWPGSGDFLEPRLDRKGVRSGQAIAD